uniref:Uncharacterized protein n=1 Tax=Pavo cristatus TaxID=9049 RepID=A0A8C9EMU8_PAVCR
MGRKLDPNRKEKRGPGRKARKQRGAEVELARFLPPGKCGPCWRGALAVPRGAPPECCLCFCRRGDRPEEAVQPRFCRKNPVPYLVPYSVISLFATVSEAWGACLCL